MKRMHVHVSAGESTNYGTSFAKGARVAHTKACCGPKA